MTLLEAIEQRHSVRQYLPKTLEESLLQELEKEIAWCNEQGKLHIQLIKDKEAFQGLLPMFGRFKGVENYLAIVGEDRDHLAQRAGYYGEHLVLQAQTLGLNTCWVGGTFCKGKSKAVVCPGQKQVCVITLGYGVNQGAGRKSKSIDDLCNVRGNRPKWFEEGMKAAALAPTALNQQKFRIRLTDNGVEAKSTGFIYDKVDLGIVKCHFEIAAGKENFVWKKS